MTLYDGSMGTFDRRQFLGAAGSVVAGGVVSSGFANAESRPQEPTGESDSETLVDVGPCRRGIKRSLKYGMISEGSTVLEKFQLVADLGFEGVELNSPNNLDSDEVLEAMETTGLKVPGVVDSVHWGATLGDPDAEVRQRGLDGLLTALRDCKTYGGDTVLLVPGVVNAKMPYHLVYERSQTEIRKALPLAEELGVRIAFENVWNNFLLSPVEAARYVDEFESDRVGWYLDVGNLIRYGWAEHWVQALERRILKLDIKGYSRKLQMEKGPWKGFNVKVGADDCNWPAVMSALDELGYRGWASAEVGGGDRKRLTEVLVNMTHALDAGF